MKDILIIIYSLKSLLVQLQVFHIFTEIASLKIHFSQLLTTKVVQIFPFISCSLSQEFWFYFQIDVKRGAVTLHYGDLNDSLHYPNPAVFHNNAN